MVIFLAGLQDISAELYEAAELDGANAWQRFRHVTLPGLRPVTIFVLTITILASANVFGQPYLITQGQPGGETRSAIMQIGEEGLRRFNMGSASAMSTMLTLALLLDQPAQPVVPAGAHAEGGRSDEHRHHGTARRATEPAAPEPRKRRRGIPWRAIFLGLLALLFLDPAAVDGVDVVEVHGRGLAGRPRRFLPQDPTTEGYEKILGAPADAGRAVVPQLDDRRHGADAPRPRRRHDGGLRPGPAVLPGQADHHRADPRDPLRPADLAADPELRHRVASSAGSTA